MTAKKDIEKFTDKLKAALSKRGGILDQDALRAVGEQAIFIIVKRTRLGYGVKSSGAQRYKLPPLSNPYIELRRRYKLDSNTSAKKSNLTRSGQLLNSMGITGFTPNGVKVGPKGGRSDSSASNADIAAYQIKQGRTFNNLSDAEYRQLIRFVENDFTDILRKKKLTLA